MKFRVAFLLLPVGKYTKENGETLPHSIFAELRKRWPQFFLEGKAGFHFEAYEDDSVFDEVITFLRGHGRGPYRTRYPSLVSTKRYWATHYQVVGKRVFEPEDFARAEFFRLSTIEWISQDYIVTDGGYLRIPQKSITGQKIGGVGGMNLPVCRDLLKRLMETESFKGLTFQHVEVSECRKPAEPLWKLESDLRMPPVLNHLTNADGEPFDESKDRCCVPDDFYEPFLLRFPEAAVRTMGDFDAALTRERYGIPLDHILIVSRRFRDWCECRKIKLEWYPIALE